eukprot:416220_1
MPSTFQLSSQAQAQDDAVEQYNDEEEAIHSVNANINMKKNHRHSENNVVSNTENDEEDPLHEQPNDDSKKHQRKSHPQQNNDTRSVCLEGTQHRSMAVGIKKERKK